MNFKKVTAMYFDLYSAARSQFEAMHSRKITRNYLNDKNVLTAQQLKEIKDFYGPYVKNVGTLHHAFYTEKTGVFDARWIPTDLYYTVIDRYFNSEQSAKVLDNKCLYPRLFPGISQAQTVVCRMGGFWYDGNLQYISRAEAEELVCQAGACFVKAATSSSGGAGVVYIGSELGSMKEQFAQAVKRMPEDLIVQMPIRQHASAAKLNETSVNTLRLLTMLTEEGVKICAAIIRIGVGNVKVDNTSAGGVSCGVREDGTLRATAYRLTGESFRQHPTSGVVFDGYQLEGFDKAKELVLKTHRMVPHFRLVSWDVVIDEQGEAVMLETNLHKTGIESLQLANGPLFGEDTKKILDEVFGKNK